MSVRIAVVLLGVTVMTGLVSCGRDQPSSATPAAAVQSGLGDASAGISPTPTASSSPLKTPSPTPPSATPAPSPPPTPSPPDKPVPLPAPAPAKKTYKVTMTMSLSLSGVVDPPAGGLPPPVQGLTLIPLASNILATSASSDLVCFLCGGDATVGAMSLGDGQRVIPLVQGSRGGCGAIPNGTAINGDSEYYVIWTACWGPHGAVKRGELHMTYQSAFRGFDGSGAAILAGDHYTFLPNVPTFVDNPVVSR